MPFSNRPETGGYAQNMQHYTVLQERYALLRCMSDTALGKLYWAQDLKQSSPTAEQTNLFIFTIAPSLAQQVAFEQALRQVVSSYQSPALGVPQVMDNGKESNGTRWLALQNRSGLLLSERLHEVDDRGLTLNDTIALLHKLLDGLAQQQPEGTFGYMEPGTILLNDKLPCFLSAPVAAALRLANAGSAEGNRPTLHSRYISPEVLLGDAPTAADDTFSLACIAYQLLQGQPPYGVHSTLEAAVRNINPLPVRKLTPESWDALLQGMSLQRAIRQPNPQVLVNNLTRKSRKKLLIPAASLVLGCAVALGTYQLLSKWAKTPTSPPVVAVAPKPPEPVEPPPPAVPPQQQVEPLPDKEPPQFELDQLAKEARERTEADKKAGDTIPASETGTPEATTIGQLLELTAEAIRKGRLMGEGADNPGALDYLRKVRALEPENATALKLLTQAVTDQQVEAETLIANAQFDEAAIILSVADKLITEFSLRDNLPRQVKLDTAVRERNTLQPVSSTDTPSTTTPTVTPAAEANAPKTEDKTAAIEDTKKAQDEALAALRKGNTEKARTYLDQSKSLITKFELTSLVEAQIALEKRFSETHNTTAIVSTNAENAKKDNSNPPTNSPNATANSTASINSDLSTLTARPRVTTTEVTPDNTSTSATVMSATPVPNTREPASTASTTAPSTPEFVSLPSAEEQAAVIQAASAPVTEEVTRPVSPVTHRVPYTSTKRVVAAPSVKSSAVTQGQGHVPDLIEVPLADIDAALPNPNAQQR